MNFPTSQKTGRRAELLLAAFFLDWDWNAGQDHIDSGYDLCITPDHKRYRGIRFSVQVKGTALRGQSRPAAQVAKKRLRQYAKDVLPVFIVRATPEGLFYWVHAQVWVKANPHALSGSGKSQVVFDLSQRLDDRAAFERYLDIVVEPLLARAHILDVGDPNRVIDIRSLSSATPTEEITEEVRVSTSPAVGSREKVVGTLTFKPLRTEENLQNVREAIGYGLPKSFDAEEVAVNPSPGATTLPLMDGARGRMTVRQKPRSGFVELCPGNRYAVMSQDLEIGSDLFSGTNGLGISNEARNSSLDLKLLLTPKGSGFNMLLNLGMRSSVMGKKALREFRDLASLATWADQVAFEDALRVNLAFGNDRQELPAVSPITGLIDVLQRLRCVSRLHMIARALHSEFVLPINLNLSEDDIQDINLAYELLRGERKSVNVGPLILTSPSEQAKQIADLSLEFLLTTNWEFILGGQLIGSIPIQIQLPNYVLEIIPEGDKISMSKGVNGEAWMTYSEHGVEGVVLRQGAA